MTQEPLYQQHEESVRYLADSKFFFGAYLMVLHSNGCPENLKKQTAEKGNKISREYIGRVGRETLNTFRGGIGDEVGAGLLVS